MSVAEAPSMAAVDNREKREVFREHAAVELIWGF